MAGLCTNHVVVVVLLLFVLVVAAVVAMAMVSERLSVPAKIMYARARINQQRSQRGLKSRPTHACKLKRC